MRLSAGLASSLSMACHNVPFSHAPVPSYYRFTQPSVYLSAHAFDSQLPDMTVVKLISRAVISAEKPLTPQKVVIPYDTGFYRAKIPPPSKDSSVVPSSNSFLQPDTSLVSDPYTTELDELAAPGDNFRERFPKLFDTKLPPTERFVREPRENSRTWIHDIQVFERWHGGLIKLDAIYDSCSKTSPVASDNPVAVILKYGNERVIYWSRHRDGNISDVEHRNRDEPLLMLPIRSSRCQYA